MILPIHDAPTRASQRSARSDASRVARVIFVLVLTAAALTSRAWAMHPDIPLLDTNGDPVIRSGAAVSTMKSCGTCHDTAWIEKHSSHAWLGLDEMGKSESGRPFDAGTGPINRWDPLSYDRVSFDGNFTIGIADWLRTEGWRHVGGGFATTTDDGTPLTELEAASLDGREPAQDVDPWTYTRSADGSITTWDWKASGVAEMNCFVCHLDEPADAARRYALREGQFGWAATATLETLGLVERTDEGWRYQREHFDGEGRVSARELGLRPPDNDNCGLCHGAVITRADDPFWFAPSPQRRLTETTGEIVAPGRIARSGMNVRDRASLSRAWDVHAERLLSCTDCHASTNDPVHFTESTDTRPSHLDYDARRIDPSEFLRRPSHEFAKGSASHSTMRNDLDGSMRRCEDCHDASAAHEWLPYRERHLAGLTCEACHVPQTFAPARRTTDWTVLDENRQPRIVYRGLEGDPKSPIGLVDGYRPALLPRVDEEGRTRLAPHNLVTTWYWFDRATEAPVTRAQLEAAWFEGDAIHPRVRAALDVTGNGSIESMEFGLFQPFQVDAIASRLQEVGVGDPEIRAEVQPYSLHHGVASGRWATRECQTCHGEASRTAEEFLLAEFAPGDVMPTLVGDSGLELAGAIVTTECGHIVYRPDPAQSGLYLLGYARERWVDKIGWLALMMVVAGVTLHGGLRLVLAAARRRREMDAQSGAGRLEPDTEGAR